MKTVPYQFDPAAGSWFEVNETSTKPKVALIQLGRYGDLVNALPLARMLHAAGKDVHFYSDVNFMDLFDAVSYVTLHPTNIGTHTPNFAASFAENDGGYEEILLMQVHGNNNSPMVETDNFTLHQWANAGSGWLNRYHEEIEPLFDRRDYAAEANATAVLPPDDGKPLLLVNFKGVSSPYRNESAALEWVRATLGTDYRIFDLGTLAPNEDANTPNPLALPRIHHLLGFLDRATALITVDTATLHFAAALNLPTVQLSDGRIDEKRKCRYFDSEPRNNVVFKCSYENSLYAAYRNRIVTILKNREFMPGQFVRDINWKDFPRTGGRKVYHVADWYDSSDGETAGRMFRARATWEDLRVDRDYELVLHKIEPGGRSSWRDLGDTRKLPYVRDLLDYAAWQAGATDEILVLTNADVCLVPETLHEIRAKLKNAPCCYSRRVDVDDSGPRLSLKDLRRVTRAGADLFACTVAWWKENRDKLPDMLLGAEAWDTVYRWWMLQSNKNAEMFPPVIYHERHPAFWNQRDNILSNPAQVYNRKLAKDWLAANGADAENDGKGNLCVLKPDSVWLNNPALAI